MERRFTSHLDRLRLWAAGAAADARRLWRIRPGTAHLVAYPKTGSTWLRFMTVQLLVERYDLDASPLSVRLNRISNASARAPAVRWTHDDASLGPEQGPREDPERLFAYGWRFKYARSRVALLLRDPRDIVVSYYHWLTHAWPPGRIPQSLSAFVRHPVFGIDRVVRFYRIWHRNRRVPRALLRVRYEDLTGRDGPRVLHRFVRFAGIDASPALAARVYENSRAERMRRLEHAGKIDGMAPPATAQRDAFKVRKARPGTHREELSTADRAYCDRRLRRLPAGCGY